MLSIQPIKMAFGLFNRLIRPVADVKLNPALQQALRTSSNAMANILEQKPSTRFVPSDAGKAAEAQFLKHFGLGIFASPFAVAVPLIAMNGVTKQINGGGSASKEAARNNIDAQLAQQLAAAEPVAMATTPAVMPTQSVTTKANAPSLPLTIRPAPLLIPSHTPLNSTLLKLTQPLVLNY